MKGQRGHGGPKTGSEAAQRGSALVLAIMVLSLLATAGIALLFLGDSDARMNQANIREKQAFYIAEAGLEDAREQLRVNNAALGDPAVFSDEISSAAGPNGRIDLNPATLTATYDASGNVTELTGYDDDVPLRGLASFGGGWNAAFLTNDALDGESSETDTNQRAMITAIGAGPNRSIKIVQAIVEKWGLPTPPAMITLIGPAATPPAKIYDDGSSASKEMTGNDCDGAYGYPGLVNYSVPVVGTFGAAATAQARAEADSGVYSSGTESGSATVHDVSGTASSLWQSCSFLRDAATQIRASADAVCTPEAPCSSAYWSSTNDHSITFVDGDLNLTAGKGLIWATGTLDVSGDNSFEGTLLVIGRGVLNRNGGGSGHSYGAIVVANIAGPDEVYGDSDDCTGGTNGFLPPLYAIAGAGTHDHVYCTSAINVSLGKLPLKVVQFRQY